MGGPVYFGPVLRKGFGIADAILYVVLAKSLCVKRRNDDVIILLLCRKNDHYSTCPQGRNVRSQAALVLIRR